MKPAKDRGGDSRLRKQTRSRESGQTSFAMKATRPDPNFKSGSGLQDASDLTVTFGRLKSRRRNTTSGIDSASNSPITNRTEAMSGLDEEIRNRPASSVSPPSYRRARRGWVAALNTGPMVTHRSFDAIDSTTARFKSARSVSRDGGLTLVATVPSMWVVLKSLTMPTDVNTCSHGTDLRGDRWCPFPQI